MQKIDLKKQFKELYNPSVKQISTIDVPQMNFLTLEGKGDPNKKDFADSIQAMYPLAYTIKFDFKKNKDIDFSVMPLEGLWWADDFNDFDPQNGNRDNWKWKLIIMQPDFVTKEDFERNLQIVKQKKKLPLLENIKFESIKEGQSAQLMHIGPFIEEGPNIQKVHDFIKQSGGKLSGHHHEIYLSDPRRTAPEKLKTIIRQSFEK